MPRNQKVFVLGMAKSGYEAAKLLSRDYQVLITDQKKQDKAHVKDLEEKNVEFIVTSTPEELLNEEFSFVVKNPGILPSHPCVQKAHQLHIPVINEVELAYRYLPDNIQIIGITGSNGKTTTTTLVYEFLKAANVPVHLGGNIGYPVCSLIDQIKPHDILLLEVSDHQLVDMKDFTCHISALLNLSETHLDFHGTYEKYKQTKKKIFNHQKNIDFAIINQDDQEVLELTEDIQVTKKYFSKTQKTDCYIDENQIILNDFKICLEDILLKGMHNYENIMAALLIIDSLEIDLNCSKRVLKTFNGVEHRIEFVKTIHGIDFYNDSKSTNPTATITALKTFQNPIILLLGGYERGQNFDELNDDLEHVKCIICYGETKKRIEEYARKRKIDCIVTDSLKEATLKAYRIAEKNQTVLLSPASASWDQYDNFEIRGNEFKQIVNQLEGSIND